MSQKNIKSCNLPWKSQKVGKCPKFEVGKCPRKTVKVGIYPRKVRKLENFTIKSPSWKMSEISFLEPQHSHWVMFQFGTFFKIVAHNLNNHNEPRNAFMKPPLGTPYTFTKPPLALSHLEPEAIEKSDSLRIHETPPSIRSLGAGDNRKVRLVTLCGHLP